MRVPVPGQWIENISMEESKLEYILSYGPHWGGEESWRWERGYELV